MEECSMSDHQRSLSCNGLSDCLRRETKPFGIDVIVIEPEVVGTVIAEAATSRQPKARHLVGYGAQPLGYLRRILSDRWFDLPLTTAYKQSS
jgi:NAD(P)-dependent dehydrogenase (short-subunit alcohol dehydrogenase family)